MRISLPYSRKRRYLTGIDWVVGAMSHDARRSAGAGAISQAVLDVEGHLGEAPLAAALEQISRRLPLIHGRVRRDWMNLAPYWRVPAAGRHAIPLRVVDLPLEAAAEGQRLFVEHVNTPLASESQHLSFLLVRLGHQRSRLGMVFDHRLLDAFGAEAMLRLIEETAQGRLESVASQVRLTEPAALDEWERRFQSGKTLNELFFRLREREVCALAMPPAGASRRVRFVHESLTPQETAALADKAADEIGVPILLPSAAARAAMAMRRVFPTLPLGGTQHLVFTTVTTRTPAQEWEALFFNPFAFLPFSVPTDGPQSTPDLAVAFRDQLFDLMKKGVPAAMQDAAALGRIFPHWFVSKMARDVGAGRLCSLYFACVRDGGFTGKTFLGLPVTDLIHTPLAFAPPGLNLCMTWFDDHFNLVLAYVEGVLDDAAAVRLMREFKSSLV